MTQGEAETKSEPPQLIGTRTKKKEKDIGFVRGPSS
jgi:hypothetical protein